MAEFQMVVKYDVIKMQQIFRNVCSIQYECIFVLYNMNVSLFYAIEYECIFVLCNRI